MADNRRPHGTAISATEGNGPSQPLLPTILDPPSGPEVAARVAELLRPLLRNPAEAPQIVARVVEVTESFSGPMPHPRHLQAYDKIVPGSGREILSMARVEQTHRHHMQKLEMIYPYLGWLSGTVGFLVCVIGAGYLAMNNHEAVAGGMLGVPSLGVIGWFIKARLTSSDAPTSPNVEPTAARKSGRRKR